METKKYKLTEETINVGDKTLHRIEALRDFSDVKKGDKGGYIEKEENLSQNGNCWVYDDAMVYGSARVFGNAIVYLHAVVCDNAVVCGKAIISGNATIFGNANVHGDAKVYDEAKVYGDAWVYGTAEVYGNARIYGNAEIRGDAEIASNSDYIVFKNWWSSGRYFTWTKGNDMWKVGCFYGTGEQLIEKAYKDSEISGREYKKVVGYVNSIKANEYNHVRKNIKERLLSKMRKLFGK